MTNSTPKKHIGLLRSPMAISSPLSTPFGERSEARSPSNMTFGSRSPPSTPRQSQSHTRLQRERGNMAICTTVTTELMEDYRSTQENTLFTQALHGASPQAARAQTTFTHEDVHEGVSTATAPNPSPVLWVFYIPSPSELVRIEASRSGKFYVITKGEDIGIHNDWTHVTSRTNAVRNAAIFESVSTWEEAHAIYSIAYYDGTIEKIPIASGPFDTPYFVCASSTNRGGIAHMNIPPPANRSRVAPNPNAINMSTVGKKFYVMTQGEEAGIFGSWHECAVCTRGAKSVFHSCEDWEAAIDTYQTAYRRRLVHSWGRAIPAKQMLLPLQNIRYT